MKKIVCISLILIILMTIIIFGFLLKDIFINDVINISNIDINEKEEIVNIIGLSYLQDKIVLERLEIPRVYKDIDYTIYFQILDDIPVNSLNPNSDFYTEFTKISNNKYSCITTKYGYSIEILDSIIKKYKE